MAKVKQKILYKRKATNKNNKSKYTIAVNKYATQTYKDGKIINKYGYSKRIYKVARKNKYSYKG